VRLARRAQGFRPRRKKYNIRRQSNNRNSPAEFHFAAPQEPAQICQGKVRARARTKIDLNLNGFGLVQI